MCGLPPSVRKGLPFRSRNLNVEAMLRHMQVYSIQIDLIGLPAIFHDRHSLFFVSFRKGKPFRTEGGKPQLCSSNGISNGEALLPA